MSFKLINWTQCRSSTFFLAFHSWMPRYGEKKLSLPTALCFLWDIHRVQVCVGVQTPSLYGDNLSQSLFYWQQFENRQSEREWERESLLPYCLSCACYLLLPRETAGITTRAKEGGGREDRATLYTFLAAHPHTQTFGFPRCACDMDTKRADNVCVRWCVWCVRVCADWCLFGQRQMSKLYRIVAQVKSLVFLTPFSIHSSDFFRHTKRPL